MKFILSSEIFFRCILYEICTIFRTIGLCTEYERIKGLKQQFSRLDNSNYRCYKSQGFNARAQQLLLDDLMHCGHA